MHQCIWEKSVCYNILYYAGLGTEHWQAKCRTFHEGNNNENATDQTE